MPSPGNRSPIAVGFEWAARISVAGLSFVVPMLAGSWLDRRFGSRPAGLLAGLALGSVVGLLQLIRIARDSARPAG